ncbi:MAG: metallophosphoesterase [Elusimicrobiota bacterium]|nr:metallophosphoesterase [Elusimicrobiota bacterium]
MFMILTIVLYFGGFIYISLRLNGGFNIQPPYNHLVVILGLLAALIGGSTMLFRRGEYSFMQVLGPLGFILMGCFAITITVFIITDIVSLSNIFLKFKNFRYYATLTASVISVLFCAYALLNVAIVQKIKRITIQVENLPVDSIKVAAISDLHINLWTSPKVINKIFDKVAALNADIIVIVGDVIDTDINRNNRFLEYGFAKLKAPLGVFAVTGNHEYYTGVDAFNEMFQKLGVKVLNNETVLTGGTINVAGIEDIRWKDKETILKTLDSANPKYPTIFLSHRPETFNIAQSKNIFQISGHTHAGQIPPIWIARNFFMQYNYGIYKLGQSIMYLTSGTRWWGPPMRFLNTCEIVLVTLERKKDKQ